jgi:hypothetical protein
MGKTRFAMMGILLFAATLLTQSCAPSMRLTDDWKDSAFRGPAYKKIMIVALTTRPGMRQSFEDEFANQMKARGIAAAKCYECIPDVDKVTREEIIKVGAEKGVDAFLIIRLLRMDTQVRSSHSSSPSSISTSGAVDSLHTMQWGASGPTMSKQNEVATLDSRLFDAKTAKLIWRSTVDAVNPSVSAAEVSKFVGVVLDTLEGGKLIPSR